MVTIIKWNATHDPVANLKAMKDLILDKDEFKKYLEDQRKYYKFVCKQIIVGYFLFHPSSTLEECLKEIGLEKDLVCETIEELLEKGVLEYQ